MNQFKTLSEARTAYEELTTKLADSEQRTARLTESESQLVQAQTENENFRALIVQKDEEISRLGGEIKGFQAENAALSGQISGLKTELETAQKQQKSAKLHARELVAATGGAPIALDQAEINRMQAGDEKEYVAQMAKTTDQTELNRLYREYNKLFRPNGKQKKT